MARLYIIRGAPGSGKTTLAEKLLSAGVVGHYSEADKFMVDDHLQYKFDPNKLRMCHQLCLEDVSGMLKSGLDVAVSNTFTRLWEMKPYIELGHPFTVIRCEGNYGNIHGVPEWKVEEMRRRFEEFR